MNLEPGLTIPVLDHGYVRYIDHMGDDHRILEAARISYRSPSKGEEQDKKLLGYLYKNRHTSPFEMVKVTLNIKLPVFTMRQYVRHRMQNLNEVSARYTELPNEFYFPDVYRVQDVKNKQGSAVADKSPEWHADQNRLVQDTCNACYKAYEQLLAAGVAREMARMILPVNIYTEIYACWDLKNLLHFITLREDAHAQSEIRDYGKAIKTIIKEIAPWTMEAYEKYKWVMADPSPPPPS